MGLSPPTLDWANSGPQPVLRLNKLTWRKTSTHGPPPDSFLPTMFVQRRHALRHGKKKNLPSLLIRSACESVTGPFVAQRSRRKNAPSQDIDQAREGYFPPEAAPSGFYVPNVAAFAFFPPPPRRRWSLEGLHGHPQSQAACLPISMHIFAFFFHFNRHEMTLLAFRTFYNQLTRRRNKRVLNCSPAFVSVGPSGRQLFKCGHKMPRF